MQKHVHKVRISIVSPLKTFRLINISNFCFKLVILSSVSSHVDEMLSVFWKGNKADVLLECTHNVANHTSSTDNNIPYIIGVILRMTLKVLLQQSIPLLHAPGYISVKQKQTKK